ncbi:MAG: DUF4404 family protein [Polyangiales bacterium]|nr:DUF4404 family protein [Myxococcales bacterium]MCB9658493.1 DUF4404 family protein [Sandaracinaceae bacterium]
MPKQALRDALATLHSELTATESLDAETRALLLNSAMEITEALDRDTAEHADGALGARLRSAVTRFEGEHPDLVRAVGRLAEALGAAGI